MAIKGKDVPGHPEATNLTDISYNHRTQRLRMSESDYQDEFGQKFTCPTCRKTAYTYVEGGSDSPDCDSCWKVSEDLGLPHAKYEPAKPEGTPMDVATYRNHGWGSILKDNSDMSRELGIDEDSVHHTMNNFPKGPYVCTEPDQTRSKHQSPTCNQKFESLDDLTYHWTNDIEHHDDWGKN